MAKLSKSKIKKGMQCKKALWLNIHHNELASFSKDSLKKFAVGNEIGELAQGLYPNGIMVKSRKNDKKLEETKIALEQHKPVFEAAFEYDSTLCQVDVLRPVESKWDVLEVKAGTSAKEEYIEDIAIQYYIISNTELPLNKCYMLHVNKQATGAHDLFVERDISEEIKPYQEKYKNVISDFLTLIDEKDEPVMPIGPHCDKPYECEFKNYCWKHIPKDKKTIFDIPGFRQEWKAYDLGMTEITSENRDKLIELGAKPHIIDSVLSNKIWMDKKEINKFLVDLEYPLSAFDFESLQYIVPPFSGVKPYEQIPFQYSLSIAKENGEVSNVEFLFQNEGDPRKELLDTLKSQLPEKGHIMAYNMSFEKYILRRLSELFPDYKKFIDNIISRMIDPYALIEKSLYHPDFGDSYSLKSVSPVINGEQFSYSIGIANGEEAQEVYKKLIKSIDILERIELNMQLRSYCEKDTMNLILLIENLKKLVKDD